MLRKGYARPGPHQQEVVDPRRWPLYTWLLDSFGPSLLVELGEPRAAG
ncbi:hypothetical protein KCG47_02900 [Microvirga sp. SRT04]|nr:hypothetical protein [Microvirga sp. SRT04]